MSKSLSAIFCPKKNKPLPRTARTTPTPKQWRPNHDFKQYNRNNKNLSRHIDMPPPRGAHLTGFPRFRHANEQRGQFIFDGTPAGEKDFKAMDDQSATWITQRRDYKKLTMVQENGYIAAKRREYEDESIDRLVYIIGERNQAKHAKEDIEKKCSNSIKDLKGELKLNTAAVERRVETEGIIVDKARAAWVARKSRKNATHGDESSTDHHTMIVDINKKSSLLLQQQPSGKKTQIKHALPPDKERIYMRFLKEGPNRGDGCFQESVEEESKRIIGRTFERTSRYNVVRSAFSERS
jgi:hypothetical protein